MLVSQGTCWRRTNGSTGCRTPLTPVTAPMRVPKRLAANCGKASERAAWLNRLPDALRNVERKWSLTLGAPFDGEEVSCAWVAPATLADATSAVLKLGMPHIEGE